MMKYALIFILMLLTTLAYGQIPCSNSITMQPPAQVDICDGETREVSFSVFGFSELSYRWYVYGNDIDCGYCGIPIYSNNSNYSGANTNTLTIYTNGLGVDQYEYYCYVTVDGCPNLQTDDVLVNVVPSHSASPSTTGASGCGPQSFTLSASGAPGGSTYAWFDVATGGTELKLGSIYNTPQLSTSTTYYVAIRNSNNCDGPRKAVLAQVNSIPNPPTTTGNNACGNAVLTLTATGGSNGQYRWYTQPTGGSPISGETSATYTTPALSSSTSYYVTINDGTCESNRTSVTAEINTVPAAPTTSGDNACGSASLTLTATGGSSGHYLWYTQATGGSPIAGETSATYATPTLSSTTTYYVAVNDGTCESTRTAVVAEINTIPAAPSTTGDAACGSASLTLIASGGSNGEYRWYDQPTGGSPIAGETNATYTTPILSSSITYYVAINNGNCEGTRTAVDAEINTVPTAPTTTGGKACGSASLTLTATGGSSGHYLWYTQATGGSPIAGETSATYATPTLSSTTTYYVAVNDGTCESTRTAVVAEINVVPAAPITTGDAACGSASLTLIASGGSNGEYRWYDQPTGGSPIAGETSATYTTPILSSSITYYVSINNGNCEGTRTAVDAEINTVPAAPTTSGDNACGSASLTLTATGGSSGHYLWYTQATGGSPIAGETEATFTTTLSSSATYYVAINNGNCESERSPVEAIIYDTPDQPVISADGTSLCEGESIELSGPAGFSAYLWSTGATTPSIIANEAGDYTLTVTNDAGCVSSPSAVLTITTEDCIDNLPPAIDTEPVTTEIGSVVTINLLDLISDPDNNLDLSTLQIAEQPQSGATAVIDANHNLVIDYSGISFSGVDQLVISVCDVTGSCTQQTFNIDVVGDIVVYNAISPNGDGKNDYLYLQYIDVFDETKENRVSIYNRWGSVVFETTNYNNETNVFSGLNNHGNALPSGTYYYKIEFASGKKDITGYISLRR